MDRNLPMQKERGMRKGSILQIRPEYLHQLDHERNERYIITHRDKIFLVTACIQNSIESPTSRSVWRQRMHSERPNMRVILICIFKSSRKTCQETASYQIAIVKTRLSSAQMKAYSSLHSQLVQQMSTAEEAKQALHNEVTKKERLARREIGTLYSIHPLFEGHFHQRSFRGEMILFPGSKNCGKPRPKRQRGRHRTRKGVAEHLKTTAAPRKIKYEGQTLRAEEEKLNREGKSYPIKIT